VVLSPNKHSFSLRSRVACSSSAKAVRFERFELRIIKNYSILVIHIAATFIMVGVIWLVQLVHYPLMSFVEASRFSEFEQLHQVKIFWIVAPTMFVEGITAIWLAITWPSDWRRVWMRFGLLLVALIWLSTIFIQIPLHDALQSKFLESDLDRLVASNWIRTIAWSLRGAVCFFLLITIDNLGLWQPKRNANKS